MNLTKTITLMNSGEKERLMEKEHKNANERTHSNMAVTSSSSEKESDIQELQTMVNQLTT